MEVLGGNHHFVDFRFWDEVGCQRNLSKGEFDMKMNHIFMISMMGGSYPAFLMAGDDGGASSSNTIQRSSRTISLGALFRHCSHTSLNDHQTSNHSMVGSLGSNSSGELQIVTTPKMSKLKRLSCMMSRRSSSSSSSSISSPASIVKEVGSEKSLKELERQLEDELE